MIPSLKHHSLLSIGQLCDNNSIALFWKKYCYVIKNQQVLLSGTRNLKDGLWDIHLPTTIDVPKQTTQQQVCRANSIVPAQQTKSDLAAFFHASMCSPVLKMLQQAIRNDHLVSWSRIDKINFEKFITDTLAIDKGHLDHEQEYL